MKKVIPYCFSLFVFFIYSASYAQTTLISSSGDGGFESGGTLAANGWTVIDGTATTWFVGTVAGAQGGTNASFVGSNSSTYAGSSSAVIKHFYRDVAIPSGATQVYLNYYLKIPTIDNTYDYLYIYTNTTAQTPVAGSLPAGTQKVAYTTPALANFTAQSQIDLTSLAGTTVRLVFTYKTDAAPPNANPAVDNISLTYISSCTAPTTQATSFTSGSITQTTMTVGWTRGNGDNVLVIAKDGSPPTDPTSGTTYTGNAAYGSGTAVGGGFAVYNGTGTSVNLTALTASTTYYFAIYEYATTGTCYNLTELTGNATTTCTVAPSAPASAAGSGATATSFNANWTASSGATNYYLDVCTDVGFTAFVAGYNNLNVGNVVTYSVTSLTPSTTYYYRIRAYNACGTSASSSSQTISTTALSYCASNGTTTYQTGLTNVTFNTINNSTAKPAGYNDYIAQITDVTIGSPYTLSARVNTDGAYTIWAKAWIDWNGNGVFDIATEEYSLGSANNTANGVTSITPSITIPGVVVGNKRMRVSAKYNAYATSCETGFDGEVEDYTVNVVSACMPPTTQASTITFSNVQSDQMNVAWSIGNGINRIVIINTSNSFTNPTDGTDPTANAVYGGAGEQVIYNSSGNNVTVTGLSAGITYWFRVYEFNCSGTETKFNTSTGANNPNSQTSATCTSPSTQASGFSASSITANSMTINWTRGNGDNVLVVARAGSTVNADPAHGTGYTANAVFGSGNQIGAGNYVVYDGAGTSVNITSLSNNTTYYFAIYEYNTAGNCYALVELAGNATTLCTPPGDPTTYTNGSLRTYTWSSATGGSFTTYQGYLDQSAPTVNEGWNTVVNNNWVAGSISGANICGSYSDLFATKNRGYLSLPKGVYTFRGNSNDGNRLYARWSADPAENASYKIMDDWADHATRDVFSSRMSNSTGGPLDLFLDFQFYENAADAIQYLYIQRDVDLNTPTTATQTKSGSLMAFGAGVTNTTDQNWYQVDLASGAQYRFWSTNRAGGGGWADLKATLYNNSFVSVASDIDGGDFDFTYSSASTETYWLYVTPFYLTSTITYTLNYYIPRACATCTPTEATLGTIGTTVFGYNVSGNCGGQGKWDASFTGEVGYVYHFDLCPDVPGSGTNNFDIDIKITDASCSILSGVDGSCSSPSYAPNDFQWACPANAPYYVILAPFPSYNSHTCTGSSANTFTMYYYKIACSAPTIQANNLIFSNIQSNQLTVACSNGNGTKRIVIINTTNNFTDPTDGTDPVSNAVYSGSGEQVIYNNSGNNVTVTGLTGGTTYWFRVYEYNCVGAGTKYIISNAANNPNSQTTATCTSPTTQAIGFSASSITANSMTVNWTRGNGDNVLVVARAGSTVNADPVHGTSYSANSLFGAGNQIGAGNYVVYNGSGNSVNITGLSSYATYYFAIYEYNNTGNCYALVQLTGGAATLCSPPSTQATGFTSSAITTSSMTVGWTRGNGTGGVLVVARSGSTVNQDPTNGATYTANAAFGSGTQIGTGNYVVYKGTGSSVNITGLTSNTTYYYAIYEYSTTGICHLLTELTGYATTNCISPTTQATNISFSNIQSNQMSVTWTNGNGSKRVVIINTSNSFTNPTNGTDPAANSVYGGAGEQVIYNNTGNNVIITGLSGGTTYWFRIYELNCTGTQTIYITSTATNNPNSQITATCTSPITQASGFGKSSITNTTMTINWTRGNGDNVLVVARAGSTVNSDPTLGTSYTANSVFGTGDQIGAGNYVVYSGSATSVNVTGLSANTSYYFAIYEFNNTGMCFKLNELTGNATTSNDGNNVNHPVSGSATYYQCSGTYYDNGGSAGNYTDNIASSTVTFYPSTAGTSIQLNFSQFLTESATCVTNYDWLKIYNGPSNAYTLINCFSTSGVIPTIVSSSHSTGSLTIQFQSNAANNAAGWTATISCCTPPSTPTVPSGTTSRCVGAGTDNYTTSSTGATDYTWSVTGAGNSISGTGTTGTVTWAAGFSGTATVSVIANNGNCPSIISSTSVAVGTSPCASLLFPLNGSTKCPITLYWNATTGSPTGYKIYFGTNNPPTNIVNGTNLGLVLSYSPGVLNGNTTFYWKVVPVNGCGDATGCSVWSFTTGNSCGAQGQDCITPNAVCSSVINVGNPGYQDIGNSLDFRNGQNCINQGEKGSSWYTINIVAAGNLMFNILPNDYNGSTESDYDFAIWKTVGSGATNCNSISTGALPVRCNYNGRGITGLYTGGNAPPPYNNATYDPAFETPIAVVAGETFSLNVSNFTGSPTGFNLDFNNTAAGVISYTNSPFVVWSGGAGDNDWFKTDNWGGCAIPSSTIDAIVSPSSTNQPIINAVGAICKGLTVNPDATLSINSGFNLDVFGDFINDGNLSLNTSSIITLKSTSSTTQTISGNLIGSSKFGDLTINKTGGIVNLNSTIDVGGNFSILNPTSNFDCVNKGINLSGNWNNNGIFNAGSSNVLFVGASAQSIGGGNITIFNNLTVNNTSSTGITLNQAVNIAGALTLTDGELILNSNTITVTNSAATAIIGGGANSYIKSENEISIFQWNIGTATGDYYFPFGINGEYIPFRLNKTTAGIGAGTFSISTWYSSGNAVWPTGTSLCGIASENDVTDRFWVITPNSYSTNPTVDVYFYYTTAELDGINESDLIVQRWNSALVDACKWENEPCFTGYGTVDDANNFIVVSGVSEFSPWAMSRRQSPLGQLPITTSSVSPVTLCRGGNITINYDLLCGTYNAGNIFTVQLSDATGSFSTPTNIGNVNSTTNTPIVAAIPTEQPMGTLYRIRVISSDPSLIGSNNGSNLTVPGNCTFYWVGGAGNWDDVNHWSITTGGVGGAGIPNIHSNVYIDDNSGTSNAIFITIPGPALWYTKGFNMTGTNGSKTPIVGRGSLLPRPNSAD